MNRFNFVAAGDTFHHKDELKALGFRFRSSDKAWIRPVPENDLYWTSHIRSKIKQMKGVALWEEKQR